MYKKIKNSLKIKLIEYKNQYGFIKDSFLLLNASILSQLISVVISPILTRVYSPSDIGVLGLLIGIIGLFSVFSTFSYSNALILVDENELNNLVGLCLKSIIIVTLTSFVIVFVFQVDIARLIGLSHFPAFLYLVPLSVFLNGFSSIYMALGIRYKYFKIISINKIISAATSAVLSVSIGIYYKSVLGLIIGFFIGQIINGIVFFFIFKNKNNSPDLMFYFKLPVRRVASNFSNFPKYGLPTDFINNFINQMPNFLIGNFASSSFTATGYYNLSNKILGLPISLLSSSIGDVFKQKAASDYTEYGNCREVFLKTFKLLFIIAILPFTLLVLFSPVIFQFVFGNEWRIAGEYAQILSIMFFFRFIISPLTYVFYIYNKQKIDFYLHLMFIIFGFLSLFIGLKIYLNVNIALFLFSVSYSLIYILYFFLSLKFCSV